MIGPIYGLQKVERIPTGDVTDLKIKTGNAKLTIFWGEPRDSNWKKTKLVMKQGSYPRNAADGTVLVTNEEKDKYKSTGFEVNDLTNGETYYFQLFTYSTDNAVNKNEVNRIQGTPKPFKVMTAVIDLTNPDPATCITYADDAVGMTPGSDEWDEWFGEYPCLFKEGQEVGRLNPNNFAQFEDGSTADITSGDAGDVMIAFPRRGLKIETSEDGNVLTVSMTDNLDSEDFKYYAHSRGEERREVFYLGAYKGHILNGRLRSLSGKIPTGNLSIIEARENANRLYNSYEQSGFYQLTYRQAMYILKYANLNSQKTIGMGFVTGSNCQMTGATNEVGMNYGKSATTSRVKLSGIEDCWGNLFEWIDGIMTDADMNILTTTEEFGNSNCYINQGQGASSNIDGYMSKPQGTSETGFIVKEVNGNSSTYFCDNNKLTASNVAYFGAVNTTNYSQGIFNLNSCKISNLGTSLSARLMYL